MVEAPQKGDVVCNKPEIKLGNENWWREKNL
jgi:hypothetical protein